MPATSRGRKGRPYERIRRRVLARSSVCVICGEQIDPALRWPDPRSASLEHLTPLSLGGAPLDPDNLGAAHLSCNCSRGDGRSRAARPTTSRDW
jgi:5-methylcytosine-specific restriction endonuclease McrA